MKYINDRERHVGVFVPCWLLKRTEISDSAKVLYAQLAFYTRPSGVAFPKIATLCKDLGKTERTLHRHLAELVSNGLIERRRRGANQSNVYVKLDHPWMHENVPTDESLRDLPKVADTPEGSDKSVSMDLPKVAGPIEEKTRIRKSFLSENPYVPTKRFQRPTQDEVFDYGKEIRLPKPQAEAFMDYHDSKGWKVGSQPMKDWKAAMRTWTRHFKERGGTLLPKESQIKGRLQTDMIAEHIAKHGPVPDFPDDGELIQKMLRGEA